jgi:hypothetical protein
LKLQSYKVQTKLTQLIEWTGMDKPTATTSATPVADAHPPCSTSGAAKGDSAAALPPDIAESILCAQKVLDVYKKRGGFEPRAALMLTLKDLMIYCEGHGLDFNKELKMARLSLA